MTSGRTHPDIQDPDPAQTDERAEILRLGEARNKTLLDIGAGPLAIIAARDFNCFVTTIDVSRTALEKAEREAAEKGLTQQITFAEHDATSLPYPDNSFDVVVSYGALHHVPVPRREAFIREAFRVAREKIIIAEFNKSRFPHSEDEYERVDLDWLESELKAMGRTETYEGESVNAYVCST